MTTHDKDGDYEVYWPRAQRRQARKALAPRLGGLAGKTIAFAWTYAFRGDEIMRTLQEGLQKQFPDTRFVNWAEFGNIHGSDERAVVAALPGRLKALGADAVIVGVAA